jgi:hypothetical protein
MNAERIYDPLDIMNSRKIDVNYANELYNRWYNSNSDLTFIDWLHALTLHYCQGGASRQHMDLLQKTVNVLVEAIKQTK